MDFRKFSQLVMIEQTLFALPFAYLGCSLPAVVLGPTGSGLLWLLQRPGQRV